MTHGSHSRGSRVISRFFTNDHKDFLGIYSCLNQSLLSWYNTLCSPKLDRFWLRASLVLEKIKRGLKPKKMVSINKFVMVVAKCSEEKNMLKSGS